MIFCLTRHTDEEQDILLQNWAERNGIEISKQTVDSALFDQLFKLELGEKSAVGIKVDLKLGAGRSYFVNGDKIIGIVVPEMGLTERTGLNHYVVTPYLESRSEPNPGQKTKLEVTTIAEILSPGESTSEPKKPAPEMATLDQTYQMERFMAYMRQSTPVHEWPKLAKNYY